MRLADRRLLGREPVITYLNEGLPPGPIANPGLKSIEAVLRPAQHDYLYLMAIGDGSGRHAFARTFAEHQENVRRYGGR
ncbi:MAG: endolytic transglycosylase MltG [Anaerolineae bacterium]